MIVIDASVALAWSFEDEQTPATDAIMASAIRGGAHVPAIWPLEVANVLQMAVRRGRTTPAFVKYTLDDLLFLNVLIDSETMSQAWGATLDLSDRYRLTIYDAAYLELAIRLRLPLATLDKELRNAARAAGVPVLPESLP